MTLNNAEALKTANLIQNDIVRYLGACQFASWNNLKKNIYNLYTYYSGEETENIDNVEYKTLFPLLRAGIIESARRPENNKLVYCLGHEVIIRNEEICIEINPKNNEYKIIDNNNSKNRIIGVKESLELIKSIPSLNEIITNWKESDTEVHYIYDRFNKNHYLYARDVNCPNLYTNRDRIYSNKYIRIGNGNLYLIPEIEENIDGVNIALCYLQTINHRLHFKYDKSKRTLTCFTFHTILPFILCRVLILCDPMILIDGRIYESGHIHIKNITDDHVKELKRIFGNNSLEESNE